MPDVEHMDREEAEAWVSARFLDWRLQQTPHRSEGSGSD
jgi:hypothetical protein